MRVGVLAVGAKLAAMETMTFGAVAASASGSGESAWAMGAVNGGGEPSRAATWLLCQSPSALSRVSRR